MVWKTFLDSVLNMQDTFLKIIFIFIDILQPPPPIPHLASKYRQKASNKGNFF